jgi:hypothetical protein
MMRWSRRRSSDFVPRAQGNFRLNQQQVNVAGYRVTDEESPRRSHETPADLVSVRRPSVTHALGDLRDAHVLLLLSPDRWLLRGEPPAERPRALDEPALAIR